MCYSGNILSSTSDGGWSSRLYGDFAWNHGAQKLNCVCLNGSLTGIWWTGLKCDCLVQVSLLPLLLSWSYGFTLATLTSSKCLQLIECIRSSFISAVRCSRFNPLLTMGPLTGPFYKRSLNNGNSVIVYAREKMWTLTERRENFMVHL